MCFWNKAKKDVAVSCVTDWVMRRITEIPASLWGDSQLLCLLCLIFHVKMYWVLLETTAKVIQAVCITVYVKLYFSL